jgi:DNA polymerase III subunit beta
MKFTVDRDVFASALSMANGIAADGASSMPIIGMVLLKSSGEDRLEISATDLELSLRTGCAASILEPGQITLPAKLTLDLVRGLYHSSISIETDANHQVTLQSGKSRRLLPSLPPEDFPLIPATDGLQFAHLGRKAMLKQAFDRVLYAVPRENDPFSLSAACLRKRPDGSCRVYGSDGHRMAYCDLPDFPLDLPGNGIGVPLKAVKHVQKHLEAPGEAHLAEQEGRIILQTSYGVLDVRLMAEESPDFESIVPRELAGSATLDGDQLQMRMASLVPLARASTQPIGLRYEPGNLLLTINGLNIGSGEDEMEVDYDGEPFSCHVNYHYLKDVCRVMGDGKITMRWVDHMHPFLFLDPGNPGVLHLIMPMVV